MQRQVNKRIQQCKHLGRKKLQLHKKNTMAYSNNFKMLHFVVFGIC